MPFIPCTDMNSLHWTKPMHFVFCRPLEDRRKLLTQNVTEIPNHIQLSEMHLVKKRGDLSHLIARAITEGLEGLVLKDARVSLLRNI